MQKKLLFLEEEFRNEDDLPLDTAVTAVSTTRSWGPAVHLADGIWQSSLN